MFSTSAVLGAVLLVALAAASAPSEASEKFEIRNTVRNTSISAMVTRTQVQLMTGQQMYSAQQRPNDFVMGFNETGNVLARSEIIQSNQDTYELRVYTAQNIQFVEARDRSATGTGGIVRRINGGIEERYLYMVFGAVNGQPIDFAVSVWTAAVGIELGTPVAEFRVGNLTDRSLLHFGDTLWLPAENATDLVEINFEMKSMDGFYYTFIETIDMSESGSDGGRVLITRGGIGYGYVGIRLMAAAAGRDVKLHLVTFAENILTGGNNIRIGDWSTGLDLIDNGWVMVDAQSDTRVRGHYSFRHETAEVRFVQVWDTVENGSGRILRVYGGVGMKYLDLRLESGIGEPISSYVAVFVPAKEEKSQSVGFQK